ncbi:MAG: hypothetical protein ACI8TQ_001059, partial [Planctomycetota bacterium]
SNNPKLPALIHHRLQSNETNLSQSSFASRHTQVLFLFRLSPLPIVSRANPAQLPPKLPPPSSTPQSCSLLPIFTSLRKLPTPPV